MATHIYPTETPVGDFLSNDCDRLREYQWAQYAHDIKQSPLPSFVLYGGALHAGTGLQVHIEAGQWIIGGRRVETDAESTLGSLAASNTNYIWLSLVFTGNLVTSASFSSNTTGTAPSTPSSLDVLCGIAITGGSSVTSCTTSLNCPRVNTGTYTGDGTTNKFVFLGATPKYVIVEHTYAPYFSGIRADPTSYGVYPLAGTMTVAVSNDLRPEICTYGFKVSYLILNTAPQTYYYLAFF